jgi:uncharacterized membrane protein YgcG
LPANNGQPDNLATAITDVSERVTRLVHDEIELAKAEMAEKAKSLAAGAGVIAAGAVFGVFAIIFVLVALALVFDSLFTSGLGELWIGFAFVLVLLMIGTVAAVLIARRLLRVGAPTPSMAIDEARKIRDTVTAKSGVER